MRPSIWSAFRGKVAERNPWQATTLEWQTAEYPPGHGNFGETLPVVYRWAYDYGLPGAAEDFVPQNVPPERVPVDTGPEDLPDAAVQPAE